MALRQGRSNIAKRQTGEKFRKRKESLFRKCDELRIHCQADVYILVCRNGKYFVYKSTDHPSWPPSPEQIVSLSLVPILNLCTDSILG